MNQYARLPYEQLLTEVQDWLGIYRNAFSAFKLNRFGRPSSLVLLDDVVRTNEPLTHDNAVAVQNVFRGDEILQQVALNFGLDYTNLDELARGMSERGFKALHFNFRHDFPTLEEMTELASQTSGTLSTALLLHLHAEVRDSGLMSIKRHEEGLNLEYSLLQEVARESGYGDISHETLRRFSPVGKKAIYTNLSEPGKLGFGMPEDLTAKLGFDKQSDFVPISIIPIPPPETEEEARAKEFFDDLVKEEPQYGFKLPELEGPGPHLVSYERLVNYEGDDIGPLY